jgi:hypothetical protein
MQEQHYYDNIDFAFNRKDVEQLLIIWKESRHMGRPGERIRNYILDHLEDLADYFGISLTEENAFKHFIEDHDEYLYRTGCDKSPNDCLQYFAIQGNVPLVKLAIKKGADDWDLGMMGAAQGGHKDLVDFFIELGANESAYGGQKDLVEFFLEKAKAEALTRENDDMFYVSTENEGMAMAAQGGHKDLVDFFIREMNSSGVPIRWDSGMTAAIKVNNKELIQFFLDKYVNLDSALYWAAKFGNKELIQLLIDKGADNWYAGLSGAAEGGHKDLVLFFIDKGAVTSGWIKEKFNL